MKSCEFEEKFTFNLGEVGYEFIPEDDENLKPQSILPLSKSQLLKTPTEYVMKYRDAINELDVKDREFFRAVYIVSIQSELNFPSKN